MTAFTSVQSGNWTDPASWDVGGGRYPGDGGDAGGDTFDIQGTHAVDMDADIMSNLGTDSGTGTVAGTVRSGGTLNRNGFALTLRGDLVLERGFTLTGSGNGADIEFDSAVAGARYKIQLTQTGTGRGTWTETGAAHQIRTASGSAGDPAWIEKLFSPALGVEVPADIDWGSSIELVDMGDSAQAAIDMRLENDELFRWRGGLAMNYGKIRGELWQGSARWDVDGVTFINGVDTSGDGNGEPIEVIGTSNNVDGLRNLTNCAFYQEGGTKDVVNSCRDLDMTGTVSYNIGTGPATSHALRFNADTFWLISDQDASVGLGSNSASTVGDVAFLVDGGINPHYVTEDGSDKGLTQNVIQQAIADGFGLTAADNGDIIPGLSMLIDRLIMINNGGNLTLLNAAARLQVNRTTMCRSGITRVNVGEQTGDAQQLTSMKNCLIYDQAAGLGQDGAFVPMDNATEVDYNCYWLMSDANNLDDGSGNNSYVGAASIAQWFQDGRAYGSAGFGANDIHADPQFVDPGRTANNWASGLDAGATSIQEIARRAITVNGYDYQGNPTTPTTDFTLANYLAYIRGGLTPQNTALQGTGEGGVDRGAVDVVPADTQAPTVSSASVSSDGATIAVQCSESMQVGAGGSGGWACSLSGVTISGAAVDGTDDTVVNLTPSRTILQGESLTIAYTQPGDGFEDLAGNDMTSFSGQAVTNNSTVQASPTVTLSGTDALYRGGIVEANVGPWEVWVIDKAAPALEHNESGLSTDANGEMTITLSGSGLTSGANVLVVGQGPDNREFQRHLTVD